MKLYCALMNWFHIKPEYSHWDLTTEERETANAKFVFRYQEKRVYHTVEKKASLPNSEFYHSFIPKLLLTKVRKVFAVITSPANNSLYRPQLGFSLKLSIMRKREEKRQRPAAPVTVRHQLEKIKWHSFEEGEWPDVSMDLSSQTGSWSR